MSVQPIYHMTTGDAVDWLRSWPDGAFDAAITDPPYESLEKHRAVGTTTRLAHSKASSNDWFQLFPYERFGELFAELYRVLKKDAHLYVFSDTETMFVAKAAGDAAGFHFWKPLIWDRRRIGMGYHYRSRYQFILFFEKGKRKLNDLGVADVIEAERISQGYPAEKPVQVIDVLVRQSTDPGQVVCDPFAGSGSTGVAAVSCGRHFWGCDLCLEAVEVSTNRLVAAGGVVGDVLPDRQGQLSLL
jgi:site-specific DNA-methyltransferase (adenine-specific)